MNIRVGHGYDVHQLVEDRELWVGNVLIPHTKGCLAHSDGDVLIHALCDALLGAMALGDIGVYFKDTDPQWKDQNSSFFLRKVKKMINDKGFEIGNIDSTIVLEEPKIGKYIFDIRRKLGEILNIPIENVSVKATTSESLGFVGNREGIQAFVVCLLFKKDS